MHVELNHNDTTSTTMGNEVVYKISERHFLKSLLPLRHLRRVRRVVVVHPRIFLGGSVFRLCSSPYLQAGKP